MERLLREKKVCGVGWARHESEGGAVTHGRDEGVQLFGGGDDEWWSKGAENFKLAFDWRDGDN